MQQKYTCTVSDGAVGVTPGCHSQPSQPTPPTETNILTCVQLFLSRPPGAPSVNTAITPRLWTFLFCLEFCFSAGPASRDGRLSSKLRDGNQTGCLGACGSLNYFCLEPPARAERTSGVRANALVCRAFCHAHFSTLGSITNEMPSVGGPAGFQPAASLFITSSCSAHVYFLFFYFFHLRSLFDGSKAQRTLFSLSRLHVETHIVDNTLKRLSVRVQKGRPVSLPGSGSAGSDKVAADLRVWVESTSWCCCWVPAPMSFSSPEIQQCDSTDWSVCPLAV